MANIKQHFCSLNVYVNESDHAYRCEEFHPPRRKANYKWHRLPNMDAPILLDMGNTPMIARLMIVDAPFQFGLAGTPKPQMVVRGELKDYPHQIVFTMRATTVQKGSPTRVLGRGDIPKTTVEMYLHYYKIEVDREPTIEIDVLNAPQEINRDRLVELHSVLPQVFWSEVFSSFLKM